MAQVGKNQAQCRGGMAGRASDLDRRREPADLDLRRLCDTRPVYSAPPASQAGRAPAMANDARCDRQRRGHSLRLRQRKRQAGLGTQEYIPGHELNSNPPGKWQLVVADCDAVTGKVTNRRVRDLMDEPVSVAQDTLNDRWLIVLQNNAMLWVKEEGGRFVSSRVGAMKWRGAWLHPTSVDVSSDGRVAFAAEFSKPVVFENPSLSVGSLIFLWDGVGTEVKPAYDPILNDVSRYTFPNGSPWAKISGDVAEFGIKNFGDPTYFLK